MSLECSSNLVSFVCSTFFRTCAEVEDASGQTVWAPTLTCESDCSSFSSVWDQCMEDIATDPDAKKRFDDAMLNLGAEQHEAMTFLAANGVRDWPPPIPEDGLALLSPFSCDVSGGIMDDISDEDWYRAFMFGRLPSLREDGVPVYSHDFPMNMNTDRLYPLGSSEYTLSDGSVVSVTCSSRSSTKAKARDCPDPFLQPTKAETVESCVHPCPIPAFSLAEYDLMWGFLVIPGQ